MSYRYAFFEYDPFSPPAPLETTKETEVIADALVAPDLYASEAAPAYNISWKPPAPANATFVTAPDSININGPTIANASTRLHVKGQGVVAVTASIGTDDGAELLFALHTDSNESPVLYLHITPSSYKLFYGLGAGMNPVVPGLASSTNVDGEIIPTEAPLGEAACCLVRDDENIYWLSIDLANGELRYGTGYLNTANTLLKATLKTKVDRLMQWKEKKYEWLGTLTGAQVLKGGRDQTPLKVVTRPLPIVKDFSPYIISGQRITLRDLETGIFTPPAKLPEACRELYDTVAGPNITLNDDDFKDFADAIQWSVNTEGQLGHSLLKAKVKEFGKEDFNGTYLRITLGRSLGNSPGSPYVLEIWPQGHQSPIHDHGDAYAVIKVLHGEINCQYYDDLKTPRLLGPPLIFKEGDVTWIGENNWQVHQLLNKSDGLCCTIQCYQYGKENKEHYGFFRYTKEPQGQKVPEKFDPDSDMEYQEFRDKIHKEWKVHQEALKANVH